MTQAGDTAYVVVTGDGDLDAAAAQASRFPALDVDGRGWPEVGRRDPVIADAQARLPGLRPCGFHSPYEAAAWSVLAQRLRIVQAARLRAELIARHGEDGAFPPPHTLARGNRSRSNAAASMPSRASSRAHAAPARLPPMITTSCFVISRPPIPADMESCDTPFPAHRPSSQYPEAPPAEKLAARRPVRRGAPFRSC